jgi:hypothetical protein
MGYGKVVLNRLTPNAQHVDAITYADSRIPRCLPNPWLIPAYSIVSYAYVHRNEPKTFVIGRAGR